MNLSLKAKKAVAAGLALSTLMWSAALFVAMPAQAAPHSEGCIVLSGGTVWLITGGQRRGFTSAEVFASHGYNFGQVVAANAEDVALPVGPIMTYADGSIVKGPNDPLVYLVSNGQKRGFVSGSVFTGLGYSFSNIQWAPVNTFSDLPTGANVESSTERHPNGTWVNASGTVWMMTATGRKGVPSMEVFNSYGKSFATVVAANAADLAAPNEGVLTARAACSGGSTLPPSGNVNVSVSGPASSTLIVGQATANLANLVFSGTGTVTSLTLKRVGVSADSTLEDVFLFDGETRITDSASVSSSNINFTNSSGLFTVNGSKTISVRADIAGSAGETVGVQVVSGMTSSGSVGVSSATGNMHTLASATLAGVALGAGSDSGDTDPGNDVLVWQSTATVSTREVSLSRLSLRNIGSINNADIRNFDLLVDGTIVASQSMLDANGYVTFTMNKSLMTGARVLKVQADIIGGSSRTVEMSLRGTYDITLTDSQYGANIEPTGTFPIDGDGFTVSAGSITAQKTSDSPSGNITNNASDVLLGKWTLTASGEPIKVEVLNVGFTYTDAAGADNAATTLRNGRLLINGAQYGSTTTVVEAGTNFTVNYTVVPGSPVTVEFRADVFDNDATGDGLEDGDDIVPFLNNTGTGLKTVSGGSISALPTSDVNAGSLNVTVGSLTVAATTTYPAQTVVVPQNNYKIGSYTLTGSSTEDITLNNFSVDFTSVTNATFAAADLNNVYLKYGGNTTSSKATVSATNNSWSVNYTLPKNAVVTVEVFGDIGSTITAADSMRSELTVTGTAVQSGTSVAPSEVNGQLLTAGSGSITATADASTPAAAIHFDNQTVRTAAFKFAAVNTGYKITDITLTIPAAGVTVAGTVKLSSTTENFTAQTTAAATTTFSGLDWDIPANTNAVLNVDLVLGTVGVGAGTSGASLLTTLTAATATSSATGTSAAITESNPAGSAQHVYAATPKITKENLASSALLNTAARPLLRFKVDAQGGDIGWSRLFFEISKDSDTVLASATLWDVTNGGNTQIAGTASHTTTGAASTAGTIEFDATAEQQVSGSKVYELRGTVTLANASGDFITTTLTQEAVYAAPTTAALVETADSDATIIWSDLSASSHATTTSDWSGDYGVKDLPVSDSLNWPS